MTSNSFKRELNLGEQLSQGEGGRRPQVGVIGLGRMGEAFAMNLIASGFRVTVFDRNPEKRLRLEDLGACAVDDLSGFAGVDAVLTSLPNDEAVASTVLGTGGLADILGANSMHISMSTISPGMCRRLAERHSRAQQAFVSAPVLGNPDMARSQQLFIIASGPDSDVRRAAAIMRCLGQRIFYIGERADAASIMKLGANVLTAMTLQGMGEVLALLRKADIAPDVAFDVLTNSLFDARVHKTYGGKILAERYAPPGMTALLAAKDLRLALAEADDFGVPMPATRLVHDRIGALIERGWAQLDWSALGLLAASDAGLPSLRYAPQSEGEEAAP